MRRALALSLIIPAGYALGLALGPVPGDRILVSALLFSLMTASIADADFRHLRPRDALKGVALSYGLGGAAVALTSILVPAGVLRRGFLVIAFTLPALSSIAYATVLGGNPSRALAYLSSSYLAALVLLPLGTLLLFGEAASPLRVAEYVLLFIAVPAALSPLARRVDAGARRAFSLAMVFVIAAILAGGVRDELLSAKSLYLLPAVVLRAWGGAAALSAATDEVEAPIMAGMRNGGLAAVTVALIAGYAPTLPIILSGPFEFAIPGIAELVRSHKEDRK